MRKTNFFAVLFALIVFSASAHAAFQGPVLCAVQNYSGPIAIFWDTNLNTEDAQYRIYLATTSLAGLTTSQMEADTSIAKLISNYNGQVSMYKYYTAVTNEQSYYVRMAAVDNATGAFSAPTSQLAATSQTERLYVTNITSTVDGINSNVINFDSSTITFNLTLAGEASSPFIPPASINFDIKTSVNPKTIFAETVQLPVTVNVSSSNFSATASYSWSGNVFSDASRKHNGSYYVSAIPVDRTDAAIPAGERQYTFGVDVTHINTGNGIVYQTQGSVTGSNQIHYGPPFVYDYYTTKNCFVSMKIYDRNQTDDVTDDTLLKVIISSVPRVGGDATSAPEDWNKLVQREIWDGRNDQGLIVPNNIYRFTVDAIEFFGAPGSAIEANSDRCTGKEGTIAFDVLRIINVSAAGITKTSTLSHIKYTLSGANSDMGGAKMSILICSPGTTFYMAASSGTISYLNGAATYYYLAGDALPSYNENLKKVFTFQRTAGSQDETWNGNDEAGTALANDTYVFAMSATDDSGNHAIDNSGNDRVIVGNITIDRTSAQQASDSTAPSITSIAVSGSTITLSGTSTLTQPFTTVAVTLADTGGAGVDLTNTSISVTNPSGVTVTPASTSNDSIGTITLTLVQQSTNGTYSVRVRPVDKSSNTGSDTVYSFILSVTQSGAQTAIDESVKAYPNPAKGVPAVNFEFNTASIMPMKLEIFSITGEPVYSEQWTPTTVGTQTRAWSIVNNSNTKIATGVYLYRVSPVDAPTKKFKKVIIVQ